MTEDQNKEIELLPCPFCGETPDINDPLTFQMPMTSKWGCVVCCCNGPEVRTGYMKVENWKWKAIKEWNTRSHPPCNHVDLDRNTKQYIDYCFSIFSQSKIKMPTWVDIDKVIFIHTNEKFRIPHVPRVLLAKAILQHIKDINMEEN